jgi:ABC-type oligopeptide transport system substrate-binding subunit
MLAGNTGLGLGLGLAWEKQLGVSVELEGIIGGGAATLSGANPPQVWVFGWVADYPDAHNFEYKLLHPASDANYTGWAANAPGAEAFSALVEQAAVEQNEAARRALYLEAAEIALVQQAVVVPLWHSHAASLTKPHVTRTYARTGWERYDKWRVK